MKSSLKNKLHSKFSSVQRGQRIFIFTLVLTSFLGLFAFLLPNRTWAMEVSDYYKSYFESLGFSVFLPPKNEIPEEIQKYSNFLRKIAPNFPSKPRPINPNNWQLILSSNTFLLEEPDFSLANTLFICNSLYENPLFACSDTEITVKPSSNLKIEKVAVFGRENMEIARGTVTFTNPTSQRKILIIPENLLYTPKYREKLSNYLAGFASAEKFVLPTQENFSPQQKEFNLLKSWGIEVFEYSFAFTVFILVFRKLLVDLVWSPKKFLLSQTYKDFFISAFEFLKSIRKYLLAAVLGGAIFFPVLIVVTNTSLKLEFNPAHLLHLAELAFSPASWKTTLPSISKVSLIFYGYLILWLLTCLLYFLPTIVDLLSHSLSKIFLPPSILSSKLYKETLLFLVLLGIFLCVVGTLPDLFSFLVILLLLVLYLLFLGFREGISFSAKEKNVTLLLVSLTFLLGIGVNSYFLFRKPPQKLQDLFAVSNKLIMLPYVKTHSVGTYFKPFKLENFEHSIFVDDYLVFHPSYTKIKNLALDKKSVFEGNFWVMGMNQEDLEYLALSLPNFRKVIAQEDLTNLMFPTQGYDFKSVYSMKITSQCLFDTDPFSLDLKVLYLDKRDYLKANNSPKVDVSSKNDESEEAIRKKERSVLKSESLSLLLFPGCLEGETKTFILPLSLPYIPSSNILLEFTNLPTGLLSSVELYQDKKKADLLYLPAPQELSKGKTLASQEQDKNLDTLVVYTDGLEKNQNFIRGKNPSVDLGTLVSDLKKRKLVSDPLIIWSLDGPVVVRNEDAKMY